MGSLSHWRSSVFSSFLDNGIFDILSGFRGRPLGGGNTSACSHFPEKLGQVDGGHLRIELMVV
jgi:hypothetical protein